MDVEQKFAPRRQGRMPFEKLVREVSGALNDPTRRKLPIGDFAEEIGEHPWRVVDALDAVSMMGFS